MKKHNGYENYPTWLFVAEWTNRKSTYEHLKAICAANNNNPYKSADALKEMVESDINGIHTSDKNTLVTSLLLWIVHDVINWDEVARAFIEEEDE